MAVRRHLGSDELLSTPGRVALKLRNGRTNSKIKRFVIPPPLICAICCRAAGSAISGPAIDLELTLIGLDRADSPGGKSFRGNCGQGKLVESDILRLRYCGKRRVWLRCPTEFGDTAEVCEAAAAWDGPGLGQRVHRVLQVFQVVAQYAAAGLIGCLGRERTGKLGRRQDARCQGCGKDSIGDSRFHGILLLLLWAAVSGNVVQRAGLFVDHHAFAVELVQDHVDFGRSGVRPRANRLEGALEDVVRSLEIIGVPDAQRVRGVARTFTFAISPPTTLGVPVISTSTSTSTEPDFMMTVPANRWIVAVVAAVAVPEISKASVTLR